MPRKAVRVFYINFRKKSLRNELSRIIETNFCKTVFKNSLQLIWIITNLIEIYLFS